MSPLVFAKPAEKPQAKPDQPPWKVLVIDDEPAVHQITNTVLKEYEILGRRLECHSAFSEEEAKQLLEANPDAAICLLDVVMEAKDSGLKIVRYIREELKNHQIRIVLRTGQPGYAPEKQVFIDYDINDYKTKTELTESKLYTTLLGALRSYTSLIESDRQKDLLADVIESMPEIYMVLSQQGEPVFANHLAQEFSGYSSLEILEGKVWESFPVLAQYEAQIVQALSQHTTLRIERIRTEKDQVSKYFDLILYPLAHEPGSALILENVSLKVRYEEMVIQSEKMLSVGGLAAGIAHEINNPLSAILQGAQNASRRLGVEVEKNHQAAAKVGLDLDRLQAYLADRKITEFLDHITESAARAADIVETMLRFSRKSESRKSSTDLNDLVESTLRLITKDYGLRHNPSFDSIKMISDLDPDSGLVPVEMTEIQQVLINLIKNAVQAFGERVDQSTDPKITIRTSRNQRYLRLEVLDNGPGMTEEIRRRILEPFYTTKEVGQGTGLGLAVSYFIITNNHQGTFEVFSELGKGTRIQVELPLSVQN